MSHNPWMQVLHVLMHGAHAMHAAQHNQHSPRKGHSSISTYDLGVMQHELAAYLGFSTEDLELNSQRQISDAQASWIRQNANVGKITLGAFAVVGGIIIFLTYRDPLWFALCGIISVVWVIAASIGYFVSDRIASNPKSAKINYVVGSLKRHSPNQVKVGGKILKLEGSIDHKIEFPGKYKVYYAGGLFLSASVISTR